MQTAIQKFKQVPIHYYEAIHTHYKNGSWQSEKKHLFKSTKSMGEITVEDVASALDLGINYNKDEDCIWWDTIDIGKKINDLPEVP